MWFELPLLEVPGLESNHQNTNGKVFSKVLPFERNGGPKGYFAKPNVETFFDLTICSKTE
jgi:hypothetical protein